jgi:two-component system uhpT operon response regulator UhpA
VHQAISAGADGYLSKSSDPEQLRIAIQSIYRGDSFVSSRVVSTLIGWVRGGVRNLPAGSHLDVLSPREREVFQLVAIGKANKEIAAVLSVALGTVKKHRENLQRKLECNSAVEIARMAIREGLLSP